MCVLRSSSRGNYSLGRLFEIQLPASILIFMPRGIFVSHFFHSFMLVLSRSSSRSYILLLSLSLYFSLPLLVVVIWVFCVVVSPHTAAYIIMRTEAVSVYLWQVLVMAWQMLSNVPPLAPLPSPLSGSTSSACSGCYF